MALAFRYTAAGYENADLCAWTFSQATFPAGGGLANVRWNCPAAAKKQGCISRYYLIQVCCASRTLPRPCACASVAQTLQLLSSRVRPATESSCRQAAPWICYFVWTLVSCLEMLGSCRRQRVLALGAMAKCSTDTACLHLLLHALHVLTPSVARAAKLGEPGSGLLRPQHRRQWQVGLGCGAR